MVRALVLVELLLTGYLLYLVIELGVTFFNGGMIAMLFHLMNGTAVTFILVYALVLILDIWRDKKREKLIIKGKLSPDRLF